MLETADPFVGTSEMAARMRAFDWTSTPLGPVSAWPQSLRSALSICTGSRFPIAIYWGAELVLLYNDAWSPIPGGKHPKALGRPAKEVWPEIWDTIEPMFQQVLTTGDATYLEDALLLMHRHGYTEECYFNYTFTAIRGEGGLVEGVFNAVVETTYRVIAERRTKLLQELGRRLGGARTAADTCRLAADLLARDGADAAFCLLYLLDGGGTSAALAASAGLPADCPAAPETVSLEDAPNGTWPLGRVTSAAQVDSVSDLSTRFGAPLPGGRWPEPSDSALIAPLVTGLGDRPTGYLVIGASPRRAVDDEYCQFALQAASHIATALAAATAYEMERSRAEALAAIDRAKTAFFSNISHEFRTPLTLMLGPTEDALGSPDRALAGEALETVHRNELRLLKLVNALLDFSRIEAGRMQASYEPTDLAALTSDLASSFRSAFERAGLRYTVSCPPLSESVVVDREMWEKVVLNLLSNALKFTFDGGVEVTLSETDGHVELAVADTGIGIAEADIPRLFERFHRVAGARARTHEGSGIGLALVNDLVRLHGGTCRVDSTLGTGTTITVSLLKGSAHLPAEHVRQARAQARQAGPNPYVVEAYRWLPDDHQPGDALPVDFQDEDDGVAAAGGHPAGSPGLVLVADDNADMRDYLTRLLGKHWDVEAVGDGLAALEAARSRLPDLVLTDVMMPGLDGFELLRALRADARTSAIPVVMLSARAGEEARIEGAQAGADDYLVKPFSARELIARVGAQMSLAESARERAKVLAREQEARREAEAINRVGQMLAGELDLQKLVQALTDAATEVSGAQFGAFFYNVVNERGGNYMLYTLSGVDRDAFAHFPMPRATGLFGPTFRGESAIRLDDVAEDPRYGQNPPYNGMPAGHLPVRSYLAVPVVGRSGEVLGGLFFGHPEPGVFTERAERLVAGLAGQAAIAIDNARLFEAAQRARQAAEEANRVKDEFLATLSHELRTPLNAVLGWARLLRGSYLDERQRMKAIDTIERNVKVQQEIIEDLLDVSRIISGKLRLDVTRLDFAPIVEAAVETLRPTALTKGIRLQTTLGSKEMLVVGDANRLQQIVWNLVSNALKFTPKSGRVHVTLSRVNSHLELRVTDTGRGIAPSFLPHVFDRFRQSDSGTTRTAGGLGLGLAIVRHLVEMHGGTVSAESEGEGKGATFTVQLPLTALTEAAHESRERRGRAAAAAAQSAELDPGALDGLRVLVVDDEPDTRELVRIVLGECGAEVRTAASALEGLALLGEWTPDVILSDVGMPGQDGYDFISQVRGQGNRVPAAALTAYARSTDRLRALSAGFQAHLPKPAEPTELVTLVASLAGRTPSGRGPGGETQSTS